MVAATLAIMSYDSSVNCDVTSFTTCSPAAVYGTVLTPGGEMFLAIL